MNTSSPELDALSKAVAANPGDAKALADLGNMYIAHGRAHDAFACFQKLMVLPLDAAQTHYLVRVLGRIGALHAATGSIAVGGQSLKLASVEEFIKTSAHFIGAFPANEVAGGTLANLTTGATSPTQPYRGQPAVLMKASPAEVIAGNILIAGDTFVDSNNGFGSLELVGHGVNADVMSVAARGGKLRFTVTRPADAVDIAEPAGLLTAAPNYASWLLGELPRITLYREVSPSLKLILHGDAKPFHFATLKAFGIEETQVVVVPKTARVRARELFFATPSFLSQNVALSALSVLRETLGLHRQIAPTRSIYVSRSRLGPVHDRRIANETEVEHFLAARGFEIVHPQELSFLDQARAFASAARIVAPFGAGLANAVFCAPGVRPCIIATKQTPEFDRLFQWLGSPLAHITPARQQVREAAFESQGLEFIVDLNDLQKFVPGTN